MRKRFYLIILLSSVVFIAMYAWHWRTKTHPPLLPTPPPIPQESLYPSSPLPTPTPTDGRADADEKSKKEMAALKKNRRMLARLKRQMLSQLEKPSATDRMLETGATAPLIPEVAPSTAPAAPDLRQEGRNQRKQLPLGVALWDRIKVYEGPLDLDVLYVMQTGDFVKVYPDSLNNPRTHIHPGVDIYLAATSKEIRPAGLHLPDVGGWVDRSQIHIFPPEQAQQFTSGVDPMTLGNDPNFSTVAFYERALKNPDPVVHRVIGPRLIAILSIHEDYLLSWGALYRDYDPKIRSATLASLRQRGVGHNRIIIEDLISRLAELTKTKAQGEQEAEVITILAILEESRHPRVPAALEGFRDSWQKTQSSRVLEGLEAAMK
ncbi:MAG: hypothetical protein LHV69_04555 [Elusimicrobia bacterium]|nr:hypothetical protein [Candidatus Obscuribacterium magneticum]